jgi:hypothetical protein
MEGIRGDDAMDPGPGAPPSCLGGATPTGIFGAAVPALRRRLRFFLDIYGNK